MRGPILFLTLLVFFAAIQSRAAELTGRVVKIVDGDTIDVLGHGKVAERVRSLSQSKPRCRKRF